MALHHGGERHASAASEEGEIHLPSPTVTPATVALGVMILTFGVAGLSDHAPDAFRGLSSLLLAVGVLVMVLGIAVWLINDAREFVRTGDHSGGHGDH